MKEKQGQYNYEDFLRLINSPDAASSYGPTLGRLVDTWINSGIRKKEKDERPMTRTLPDETRRMLARYAGKVLVWVLPYGAVEHTYQFSPHLVSRTGPDGKRLMLDEMRCYYEFFRFLAAGEKKWNIAKCAFTKCANPYYYRKRLLPRPYAHRTGCSAHRSAVAMENQRASDDENLLPLALKYWPQWTPRKHANRSAWVAMMVNSARPPGVRSISGSSITRWQNEIRAIAERGKR